MTVSDITYKYNTLKLMRAHKRCTSKTNMQGEAGCSDLSCFLGTFTTSERFKNHIHVCTVQRHKQPL